MGIRGGDVAWSPAEEARLRALVSERIVGAQIAARLAKEGFPLRTRNAVMGRLSRLGLKLETRAARVMRGSEKPKAARVPRPRPAAQPPKAGPPVSPVATSTPAERAQPPAAKLAAETPVDRGGVAFLAARADQCRWPLWDHRATPALKALRVCGEAVRPGRPYCPACCALAYQPPALRVRGRAA